MPIPHLTRKRSGNHLAAIFVHAGAGYHSVANESIHLGACAAAARAGMAVIKNGGSAVDACEMAISCLEDNEMTNAGFGSNLTINGQVEGDATIVDHCGRSGAVGAVAYVKNPIKVARLVYENANKPMVLNRIPPNLLVGDGAAEFAQEQGVPILANTMLISPMARTRFETWKQDIEVAKEIEKYPNYSQLPGSDSNRVAVRDVKEAMENGPAMSHDPTIAALANESQAFSPTTENNDNQMLQSASSSSPPHLSPAHAITSRRSKSRTSPSHGHVDSADDLPFDLRGYTITGSEGQPLKTNELGLTAAEGHHKIHSATVKTIQASRNGTPDSLGATNPEDDSLNGYDPNPNFSSFIPPGNSTANKVIHETAKPTTSTVIDPTAILELAADDLITDTVGAIAIDITGRIAAASSSGGIGLKHKGRVGPAALVGIGTAVIPSDESDRDETTVACVTSGTGEHMATTLAAQTCAWRLHTGTKAGRRCEGSVATDDDSAMASFVDKDFMTHPSVKMSQSTGAIGAMAVKRTREGCWLYFAHNTDSFALASMTTEDREPATVMSRTRRAGRTTTGGRSIRPSPEGTSGGGGTDARPKKRRGMKSKDNGSEDAA